MNFKEFANNYKSINQGKYQGKYQVNNDTRDCGDYSSGFVLNNAGTNCIYQCTMDGSDQRTKADNSNSGEKFFGWNQIDGKYYCVRYQPRELGYDPEYPIMNDSGPVSYCDDRCNFNATQEQMDDLSAKGYVFTGNKCGWDNNDCYAYLADTTPVPRINYQQPYPNFNSYIYPNGKWPTNQPQGQTTLCFRNAYVDGLPEYYKNMGIIDNKGTWGDPRYRYSHPYPDVTNNPGKEVFCDNDTPQAIGRTQMPP
jgi:hypothetical protein